MFCLSAICPFLDFSRWFVRNETLTGMATAYAQYMPDIIVVARAEAEAAPGYSPVDIAQAIYAAVAGMLLLRLVVKLVQVVWIRMHCTTVTVENVQVCLLENNRAPFSFFRWIFIDPGMHRPAEVREILSHEMVHARQSHSFDILLAEILCAACWFNPLAWLLKGEIRRNLEFLVDSRVVREGVDAKSYQYHLLRLACMPCQTNITNQFDVLSLKERIMMLNTKQSPGIKFVVYTLLLPLAGLFLVANNAGAMIDRVAEK
jgi:hypothetical protein